MEFEVRQLLTYARRWWWLLLLGPIIGGITSYEVSSRSAPVFSTSALLQVNPPQNDNTFNPDSIQSSEALATSYVRLVETPPVLQPVVEQFSLSYGIDGLRDHVNAWTIPGTHYIEISVTDGDAARVAAIANAVAESLARQVTTQTIQLGNPVRDTLTEQLQSLDTQIEQIQDQLTSLQPASGAPSTAAQTQIDSLQTTLAQLQQSRSVLLLSQQSMDLNAISAQSLITIPSPAEVAITPIEPKPRIAFLLGATFGLFLAASLALLIAYLDNTVKSYTDYPALVGAPLLSRIGRHTRLRPGPGQLFLLQHPNDPVSEAIRILRTNLEFAASAKKFVSLAVASPGAGEGKSTVIANLALATAKAGLRTVLIDADLRRPTQHQIFNVGNFQGLSTYLKGSDRFWGDLAIQTTLPNLILMPSGPIPPNSADLLSLGRMQEMLHSMEEYADIILIDTPPVLDFSDALIIAAEVDAVLVVCRSEHTRLDALRRTANALEPSLSRLVGIVLNQQSTRGNDFGAAAYYKPLPRPLESQH